MKITIHCQVAGSDVSKETDTSTFGLTDIEWNALTEDEKQDRVWHEVRQLGLVEVWHEEAK